MKTAKLILTSFAAVAMLAFTFGCQPAAKVNTSTSTNVSSGSNSTTNSNATAGSETPHGETP